MAKECLAELPESDQQALWLAPSKRWVFSLPKNAISLRWAYSEPDHGWLAWCCVLQLRPYIKPFQEQALPLSFCCLYSFDISVLAF
jgi:hypothetical protein